MQSRTCSIDTLNLKNNVGFCFNSTMANRVPTGSSRGLTTREVITVAQIALSTLDRWVSLGLVHPDLIAGSGQRLERYWSPRDLVLVRIVKALREAGCPLRQVVKAQHMLNEIWGTDLAGVVLYWDGDEIMARRWDEVYSLIKEPGQAVMHIVAASIATWKHDAEELAVEIDVESILRHRREYRDRNPKNATPTQRVAPQSDAPRSH